MLLIPNPMLVWLEYFGAGNDSCAPPESSSKNPLATYWVYLILSMTLFQHFDPSAYRPDWFRHIISNGTFWSVTTYQRHSRIHHVIHNELCVWTYLNMNVYSRETECVHCVAFMLEIVNKCCHEIICCWLDYLILRPKNTYKQGILRGISSKLDENRAHHSLCTNIKFRTNIDFIFAPCINF